MANDQVKPGVAQFDRIIGAQLDFRELVAEFVKCDQPIHRAGKFAVRRVDAPCKRYLHFLVGLIQEGFAKDQPCICVMAETADVIAVGKVGGSCLRQIGSIADLALFIRRPQMRSLGEQLLHPFEEVA